MNKDDYIKLNKYLNNIFNYLEKNDKYLFMYLNNIYNISLHIYESFNDLYFDDNETTNNLSFIDIIYRVENIIKKIDCKYILDLKNILNNGELNFSYNKEEEGNYFLSENGLGIINIDREYNFQDVINLVHEFGHYLCNKGKKQTKIGYLLDEFIGRYFEIQAVEYLISNGYKEKELKSSLLIEYLLDNIYEFIKNYPLIIMYYHFGAIDLESRELFCKFFYFIDEDDFNELCQEKLELFDYIKSEYLKDCINNPYIVDESDLIFEMAKVFSEDYRYILGTVLALYPLNKNDIIDLVDNLNTKKYENLTLSDILKKLDIDINSDVFIKNIDDSINNYYKSIKKVM